MIDYINADMFIQDSTTKELFIEYDNEKLDNENFSAESMELQEKLFSGNQLQFGSCEASIFKIRIINNLNSLKEKKIRVYMVLNGDTDNPFDIGTFIVDSDKPTANRQYRDIIAYDYMHRILNLDVTGWYKQLYSDNDTKLTLKQFRDSFFDFVGVEQEEVILINDNMIIEKTINPEMIKGIDVIKALCEINGCFGHITRQCRFKYVFLAQDLSSLYPDNDLYPAEDLYPKNPENVTWITKSTYKSCQYEDYVTNLITKLQIRQEENDIGAISGNGNNCYIVEDNFLVYGKSADELAQIADNLFSVLSKVAVYRPFSAEAKGNPCIEVGDGIRLNTKHQLVETFVLQRTIKGIQALKDQYKANGTEIYKEGNSVNKSIIQLKGKTNKLERNVEETKSEIKDLAQKTQSSFTQTAESISSEVTRATAAEGSLSTRITQTAESISSEVTRATVAEGSLSTRITQNAESIKLKVTKGDISSEISQEAGKISIKSNRFALESTNCTIQEDGTIKATNVDISGKIISNEGQIGGFTITENAIYNGKSSYTDNSKGIFIGTTAINFGTSNNYIKATSNGSVAVVGTNFELSNTQLKFLNNVFSDTSAVIAGKNKYSYAEINDNGFVIKTKTNDTAATTVEVSDGLYITHPRNSSLASLELSTNALLFKLNSVSGSKSSQIDTDGLTIFPNNLTSRYYTTYSNDSIYSQETSMTIYTSGSNYPLILADSRGKLGFFGNNGATKQTVNNLTSTATLDNLKSKLNDLIDALQAYNLIS